MIPRILRDGISKVSVLAVSSVMGPPSSIHELWWKIAIEKVFFELF
mgnify:CR=1 FL=1